jgi:ELWxxDGT repeat protein
MNRLARAASAVLLAVGAASAQAPELQLVRDINTALEPDPSTDLGMLAPFVGRVWFDCIQDLDGRKSRRLFSTDGTAAGTVLHTGPAAFVIDETLDLESVLLFTSYGRLYAVDGGPGGVVELAGITGSLANSRSLVRVGNVAFFAAGYTSTRKLGVTDGTPAGTVELRSWSFNNDAREVPAVLTEVGNELLFAMRGNGLGRELWKSDGTAAGTVMVKNIRPGQSGAGINGGVAVGNKLYFDAHDGSSGFELWQSDGTATGTTRVADIVPGSGSSRPADFAAVGSTIYFTADDGVSGRELWKSDGTAVGTVQVADIASGPASPGLDQPVALGGRLYFTADDGANGRELWGSDGTAAGTAMVADIARGRTAPRRSSWPPCTAVCSSAPTTGFTASNRGPATAPGRARGSSVTSSRGPRARGPTAALPPCPAVRWSLRPTTGSSVRSPGGVTERPVAPPARSST